MKKYTPISTKKIVMIGLFSALVFASNFFRIVIPLGLDNTAIHFGNIFCLFAGFMLGGVGGGLSAGIGSFLYDLTNPLYISSAPFTFLFKFALGFICGKIANAKDKQGKHLKTNIFAGCMGSFAYTILYVGKSFFVSILNGAALQTAVILALQKGITSTVNAILAVAIAVPLVIAIKKALKINTST